MSLYHFRHLPSDVEDAKNCLVLAALAWVIHKDDPDFSDEVRERDDDHLRQAGYEYQAVVEELAVAERRVAERQDAARKVAESFYRGWAVVNVDADGRTTID